VWNSSSIGYAPEYGSPMSEIEWKTLLCDHGSAFTNRQLSWAFRSWSCSAHIFARYAFMEISLLQILKSTPKSLVIRTEADQNHSPLSYRGFHWLRLPLCKTIRTSQIFRCGGQTTGVSSHVGRSSVIVHFLIATNNSEQLVKRTMPFRICYEEIIT
jgi:hypothetical protein